MIEVPLLVFYPLCGLAGFGLGVIMYRLFGDS